MRPSGHDAYGNYAIRLVIKFFRIKIVLTLNQDSTFWFHLNHNQIISLMEVEYQKKHEPLFWSEMVTHASRVVLVLVILTRFILTVKFV